MNFFCEFHFLDLSNFNFLQVGKSDMKLERMKFESSIWSWKVGSSRERTIPTKAGDLLSKSGQSCWWKQTILVKADDFLYSFISESRCSQPTFFGLKDDDPGPKETILINKKEWKQTISITSKFELGSRPNKDERKFKLRFGQHPN